MNKFVSGRGLCAGLQRSARSHRPRLFRLMAKPGDGFMKMRIGRLDFKQEE